MVVRESIIKNRLGLHARPAAILVQVANKFQSDIIIEANGNKINAKKITEILSLGIGDAGGRIKIYAEGKDEEQAVEAISDLLENEEVGDDEAF